MSAERDLKDQVLEARDGMVAISRWIDESEANRDRPQLEALLLRFLKIGEENGEMIAEIIGWTGQNPRKGVTSDLDRVLKETLDTAATALMAIESATGNQGKALPMLFDHIGTVFHRMQADPSYDLEIASDVKIDKALEAL